MNKVILIGNLGKDPEMTYTPSGTAITKFSLAVSGWGKDAETEWFNIVAWKKLAETCSTYLNKGQKIAVEGRIVQRKYQDKEGNNRTSLEIHINDMEMLLKKDENSKHASSTDDNDFEDHPF